MNQGDTVQPGTDPRRSNTWAEPSLGASAGRAGAGTHLVLVSLHGGWRPRPPGQVSSWDTKRGHAGLGAWGWGPRGPLVPDHLAHLVSAQGPLQALHFQPIPVSST